MSVFDDGKNIGFARLLAVLNLFFMGLVALSFSQGPYSSEAQEAWYRYRSLGFFILGAVFPAVLLLIGSKKPAVVKVSRVWLILSLFVFCIYLAGSGGGV